MHKPSNVKRSQINLLKALKSREKHDKISQSQIFYERVEIEVVGYSCVLSNYTY